MTFRFIVLYFVAFLKVRSVLDFRFVAGYFFVFLSVQLLPDSTLRESIKRDFYNHVPPR